MSVVKDSKTVVGPAGVHPAMIHALDVVDRVWRAVTGTHVRITGIAEEGHSKGSLHYGIPGDPRCRALDFDADSEHLPPHLADEVEMELSARLGVLEYDWVWESMGTPNAHLHMEFDPRPIREAKNG